MDQIGKHLQGISSHLGIKPPESSEDFNKLYADIKLNELEVAYALYKARENKAGLLEAEQKRLRQIQVEEEIRRPWDHQELYRFIKDRSVAEFGFSINKGNDGRPVFVMDKNNKDVIASLCYYFTGNPQFEQMGDGWKLGKGICLYGGVGGGKSTLMALFTRNKRQCYRLVSCRDVSAAFTAGGDDALQQYYEMKHGFFMDSRVFYQQKTGHCFDDLGTEESRQHFGNRLNVMAEIMLNRYDRRREYGWECTHITTNLTVEEIEKYYGTRVKDRFREMFNLIELKGDSRRV